MERTTQIPAPAQTPAGTVSAGSAGAVVRSPALVVRFAAHSPVAVRKPGVPAGTRSLADPRLRAERNTPNLLSACRASRRCRVCTALL